MRPREFRGRIAECVGGAVQMTALRAAAHLDALQHFCLKGRTEPFGGF